MILRYLKPIHIIVIMLICGISLQNAKASSYSSSSVAQVTGNVAQGSTNQQILVVTVDGSNSGLAQNWQITTCAFTMNNTSNANVTSAKLWINSTNSFSGATQTGATINNPSGTITFTLNTGGIGNNTRYLFLTFNISSSTPCSGNTVDAFVPVNGLVIGSVGFGGNSGNKTPSPNDPAGNRQIFGQVTPSVSITSSVGASTCSGTPVTFTATPVNGGTTPSYQWKINGVNTGTNSSSFTTSTLATGNAVTCTMTSNAACASPSIVTSNSISKTIINRPKPKISPSDTVVCTGTFFTIVARDTGAFSGGYPVGTLFDFGFGPTTDSTYFVNGPGTYSVTVTLPSSFLSCSSTSNNANINYIDAPVAVLSADTVKCFGATNANIYAQIYLGTVPFHYKWYHNGSLLKDTISAVDFDTLRNAGSGTYCLVVSDSIAGSQSGLVCASDSACIFVIGPAAVNITHIKNNVSCQGGNDGAINLTVNGGTPPYLFLWSNGSTNEDISALSTGTYTVTVTDFNICVQSASFTINTTPDIIPPALNCPANIFVNAMPGTCNAIVNYVIPLGTDNCPGVHTIQSAGLPSGSVFPTGLTMNTFIATDSVGNSTTCNFMVTVSDVEPPAMSCTGNINVNNDVNSCDAIVSYSAPTATDNCSPVTITQIGGLPAGVNYPIGTTTNIFQAKDAANNTSTCSFNIIVHDVTSPVITCIQDTVLIASAGQCGKTFNYSMNASDNCSAVITQLSGLASGSLFPVGTTTNVFRATDPSGNISSCQFSVTVIDNEAPVVQTQNISLILDATGTITINPMMIDAGSTDNCSISTRSVTPNTFTCAETGVNQVVLSVTDIHGNVSTGTAIVTISSSLSASVTASSLLLCVGNTISLSGNPNGGSGTYSVHRWSGDNANLSDTTSANTLFTGTSAGVFILNYKVTDNNGCTATDQVIISVFNPLTGSLIKSDVNCNGGTDGSLSISLIGGSGTVSYIWSNGSPAASLSGLNAGNYSVTVSDAAGCSVTAGTNVTEPSLIVLSTSSTSVSCGSLMDGTATVVANGGVSPYSYLWNNGQVSATATGLSPGIYTVTVTDSHGCTKTAAQTVTPLTIGISLSSPVFNGGYNLSCKGGTNGSIDLNILSGTGPFVYSWSNGATTEDISAIAGGTYTVTVSNGFCISTGQITLSEPPQINTVMSTVDITCAGSANGSASVAVSGGIGSYNYSWNTIPVKTTVSVSGLSQGTYTVTVSDANTCTVSNSVTVTQPATINITGVITNLKCKGDGDGAINITVSGGTLPYTYLWNTSHTTEDRTALKAKTYTVTVTDAHGCTKKSVFTLTEPSTLLQLLTTKTNVRCFNGNTGIAGVNASGGVSPYSYSWNTIPVKTTSTINNLPAGTYTCSVSDAGGCVKTVTLVITQPAQMILTTSQSNVTVNGGNNGTASVSVSGGTPAFNYLWYTAPPQNTAAVNNLTAGSYTVKVTDSKGCSKTAVVVISQPSSRNQIQTIESNSNVKLFPNPTNGIVSLQATDFGDGSLSIKMYDILGNMVYTDKILTFAGTLNQSDYNFSRFPKGVYMIEINGTGYNKVAKLILN